MPDECGDFFKCESYHAVLPESMINKETAN